MRILVKGEKIQWPLPTTAHDECPVCHSKLGFLARNRRTCLGPCMGGRRVTELWVTPAMWLVAVGFSSAEADFLVRAARGRSPGLNTAYKRFRQGFWTVASSVTGAQTRQVIVVEPGFLLLKEENNP